MKTILIIGSDKISNSALKRIPVSDPDLIIVSDRSTNMNRVWKLVIKKRISLVLLFKMIIAELMRKSAKAKVKVQHELKSNLDLIGLLEYYKPKRVVLFRAGLIINKKTISIGVPLMNIHCANVPEYGGLGSIQRALDDKAINQNATLHQVTTTIDKGEVFDLEPFQLNISKSYLFNENLAYEAGIRLLERTLRK